MPTSINILFAVFTRSRTNRRARDPTESHFESECVWIFYIAIPKLAPNFTLSHYVVGGIPQGSILGPLLFKIYFNESPDICDSGSRRFLYADDANIL